MPVEIKDFLPYLDELNITQDHKEEILRIVHRAMEEQVDKAFGLHSMQLMSRQNKNKTSQTPINSVDSKLIKLSEEFGEAANDNQQVTQGGRTHAKK